MDLKLLGLNKYEEKAYLALVKMGPSSSSEISQESGVPYGKIYPTLKSLENKGLVVVIPEKAKKFQATDPKNLMKIIIEKKSQLFEIEKKIGELKQAYASVPKEVVSIIKGERNFYQVVREMPQPKNYEYDIKYTSELNPEWLRGLDYAKKNKIDMKILARYDDETQKNVRKWMRYTKKIKAIPNKGVAAAIIDDKFMFITMINSNITLIIKDTAAIKVFKALFESYYDQAENIKS